MRQGGGPRTARPEFHVHRRVDAPHNRAPRRPPRPASTKAAVQGVSLLLQRVQDSLSEPLDGGTPVKGPTELHVPPTDPWKSRLGCESRHPCPRQDLRDLGEHARHLGGVRSRHRVRSRSRDVECQLWSSNGRESLADCLVRCVPSQQTETDPRSRNRSQFARPARADQVSAAASLCPS